ncbi:MAG: hypothetical protein F9K51_08870 [Candidatus Dadabacteria bacterium]|nr:MAG: hypothetical protein F9K51_08870 [Candidatus Dadabacteria bacterium]
MNRLKITLYPVDFETPFSLGDFVMSIAILAEHMGLGYSLNPTGASVEGTSSDLPLFLKRLKNETFGMLGDKIVMVVSYPGENQLKRSKPGTYIHKGGSTDRITTLEETVIDMIG